MSTSIQGSWTHTENVLPKQYKCGHCGLEVASVIGLNFREPNSAFSNAILIRICPSCNQPTYFRSSDQFPGIPFGSPVRGLPSDVEALYEQVRECTSAGAYTPTVLACRKILMHIGVDLKAKEGLSFLEYVEYLAANGFVPPNGRGWVDHIRKKGNEANHEIVLMSRSDAEDLIAFVEMLLKFIYEFPTRIPKAATASSIP